MTTNEGGQYPLESMNKHKITLDKTSTRRDGQYPLESLSKVILCLFISLQSSTDVFSSSIQSQMTSFEGL